jgi:RNA polymerase sigma factor (sigma-70 family)
MERARAGDERAFAELTDPYRRELQVHCYRIMGSLTDAEDMLQETMLAAWRGLAGFQERSSLRSWLYRIATNKCLNALRSASRQIPAEPIPPFQPPEPSRRGEITWLQPYPDALLEGIADTAPGPDARYQATESIELAFIAGLQRMPPRQAATLVLRDVLGFAADEVADMLGISPTAVKGTLQRARAALAEHRRRAGPPWGLPVRAVRALHGRRRDPRDHPVPHRRALPAVRAGQIPARSGRKGRIPGSLGAAGLGRGAGDHGVEAEVVERPREDRHGHRRALRAADVVEAEVTALPGRDGSDNEP